MLIDFGVEVTRPNKGAFTAIFDRQYAGVGEGAAVESYSPALTCRSVDAETLAHGDELTVDGDDFVVRSLQPDGTGVTVVILEAA